MSKSNNRPKAAYALATRLAQQRVLEQIIDGQAPWDDRDSDLNDVYKALVGTLPNFETMLERLGLDGKVVGEGSEKLVVIYAKALDAGFLYGYAVARAMANGGAR